MNTRWRTRSRFTRVRTPAGSRKESRRKRFRSFRITSSLRAGNAGTPELRPDEGSLENFSPRPHYSPEMKIAGEELPTGFVGRSPRIAQIRGQIEKIGMTRTSVLIQGESGTGKEVAARALYNVNPRGQFVPIDCGSLVGPLMESELFGHTRNAFTGAGEAKRGLMDLANGGTAFFDEIGDLPLELQVKLLRVLQEREFRPVGSLQRVKVEVRILAATHRNLEREVKQGRFREALYHRLNVVRLTLPP